MSRPSRRFRENIPEITAVLVTGLWLGALFTGQDWWLAFMLVGYVAIIPIVSILFGEDEEEEEEQRARAPERAPGGRTEPADPGTESRNADRTAHGSEDALQTLRDRYARGELTDEQFERKLERLLETETLEDAADRVGGSRNRDRESETEFER